jgi:hypothetical protein
MKLLPQFPEASVPHLVDFSNQYSRLAYAGKPLEAKTALLAGGADLIIPRRLASSGLDLRPGLAGISRNHRLPPPNAAGSGNRVAPEWSPHRQLPFSTGRMKPFGTKWAVW